MDGLKTGMKEKQKLLKVSNNLPSDHKGIV